LITVGPCARGLAEFIQDGSLQRRPCPQEQGAMDVADIPGQDRSRLDVTEAAHPDIGGGLPGPRLDMSKGQ